MFEKYKGNILKIIETTEYQQKIYTKQGKNRKMLVSIQNRNIR